jgi:hypothetical protein
VLQALSFFASRPDQSRIADNIAKMPTVETIPADSKSATGSHLRMSIRGKTPTTNHLLNWADSP